MHCAVVHGPGKSTEMIPWARASLPCHISTCLSGCYKSRSSSVAPQSILEGQLAQRLNRADEFESRESHTTAQCQQSDQSTRILTFAIAGGVEIIYIGSVSLQLLQDIAIVRVHNLRVPNGCAR